MVRFFATVTLAIVIMAALCSAVWTNDAAPQMMDARYEYTACNVEYANDWLAMRESCAEEADVPVFDSSQYSQKLDDGLAGLKEAADEGDSWEFGLSMLELGGNYIELVGKVAQDALTDKTPAFFSCVREGEKPLMGQRESCLQAAMELERDAAKAYFANELDYAKDQTADLEELGADTSKMDEVVAKGDGLMADADAAFDSHDSAEIAKFYLRHSRLVLLFRLEKMVATIDYAEPIIEAGSNGNKDEILQKGRQLRQDTKSLISQCAYSDDVEDNLGYGQQNIECWNDALNLFDEFNSIAGMILEGA